MPRLIATTLSLLLLASAVYVFPAFSQTHFTDCASMTGSNATLMLPASIVPRVDGEPLAPGDEVALFTAEGICAGASVWEDQDLPIVVWGDDEITEIKDGFEADETIVYRVWDASESTEVKSVDVSYSDEEVVYRTRSTFQSNALFVLSSFSADGDVQIAPSSPLLLYPENGASDLQLDPTLKWQFASGADDYRIQVARDPSFVTIHTDVSGLKDTTFALSGLTQSNTYYWRVRAENEAGPGAYSSVRAFSTMYTGNENTPPEFFSQPSVTTKAERPYLYEVLAIDDDADAVTVSALTLPDWLVFSADGPAGTLSGIPSEADVGDHAVRLRAEDDRGGLSYQRFTISVAPAEGNNVPRAVTRVPKQRAVAGDETLTLNLSAIFEDDDGDPLQYEVATLVEGIVNVSVDGQTLTIEPIAPGTVIIAIFAFDALGGSASTSFELTVELASARERMLPDGFSLDQNYPNPFNPRTTITFSLDRPGTVQLSLYNSLGQRVALPLSGYRTAGSHSVQLDASDLPGGVYHYRLSSGGNVATRSLVLLK